MFKTVFVLSFIVATRFFGLFIILPVFSLYAKGLDGSSEFLAGVAIGIYALMQMALQTVFGRLSDKFGRKIIMLFGLLIFIVGSFICAFATDIYMMIVGRFIQGCGAVGAVAIAMISDFVREEKRGKAMAIMGSMIGVAFASAMVISPILSSKFGLSSLFYLSVILTLFCMVLLYTLVPKEIKVLSMQQKSNFSTLIQDKNLTIMNLTNFLQKMFMTMAFLAIPIILSLSFSYPKERLYIVYSVAMGFGFVAMGLAGALGEKLGLAKQILLVGVVLFVAAFCLFWISTLDLGVSYSLSKTLFMSGVVLFFLGFSAHEPIMQSVASKFAKASQRGEVLGIFNSAGYLGSFIGGVGGGYFMWHFGIEYMACFVVFVGVVWFFILSFLNNPKNYKNLYLDISSLNLSNLSELKLQKGIVEIYQKNDTLVIKYNSKLISQTHIEAYLK